MPLLRREERGQRPQTRGEVISSLAQLHSANKSWATRWGGLMTGMGRELLETERDKRDFMEANKRTLQGMKHRLRKP